MATVDTTRRTYRRGKHVGGGFKGENQAISRGGNGGGAEIIQLNANADSTRNMTPVFDGSYATPPPVTVPYGWTLKETKSGWQLIHDRQEWSTISWLVQERRATGRSYESMGQELERDGVPAPEGGRSNGRWHAERVRTLVLTYAPELAGPGRRSRLDRLQNRPLEDLDEGELEELDALLDPERSALYEEP
ncbi:MAG: hypothetical protein HOY79_49795 [Streptomyces sp.]|nr:hypothetical protein [Streptomyces sp.]